jgi:hypothetical protein
MKLAGGYLVLEGLRFENVSLFGSHVVVTLCEAGGSDAV